VNPTVLGGRYRVLRPLGEGGSAQVYLAEQLSLKRKVALKVITRRGPSQPDAQARFKREALIHSSIDHPSVVRVLDFETDGPEGTVVVLEFVEGRRLDEAVLGHPLEAEEATRLLLQLAEGLAAIHQKGVVHRDFKAENVMVSETAAGKQVRILDFGLARVFDENLEMGDGREFVSASGMVAATPAYAAPEQLRGHPANPRSDVYGFGITAYLMLTGRLPFNGPETHDFITQHLQEKPPSLRGKVPDDLAQLVEECLEKEPSRRPADGDALVSMLVAPRRASLRDELPTLASAPTRKPRGSIFPLLLLLISVVAGAAPLLAVERPWTPPAQARLLLRVGKPELALQRLRPEDASLRALALEALGQQEELQKLSSEHCAAVVSGLSLAERERLKVSFAACEN
jgi:serine/threonine protein kinase